MKETKEQKILWKILKEMYAVSNPPIDLQEDKEIKYADHEITKEKYEEILEANLSNQRLTKLKKQMIRNSVANFAPKFALLFLLIHFVFTPFCGFSQEVKRIEVYNYNNGIREITPSKIIEIKEERTEIYSVDKYGIRSLIPTEIIIDNKIYEVNESGLQELFPRQTWDANIIPIINTPPILEFRNSLDFIFDF